MSGNRDSATETSLSLFPVSSGQNQPRSGTVKALRTVQGPTVLFLTALESHGRSGEALPQPCAAARGRASQRPSCAAATAFLVCATFPEVNTGDLGLQCPVQGRACFRWLRPTQILKMTRVEKGDACQTISIRKLQQSGQVFVTGRCVFGEGPLWVPSPSVPVTGSRGPHAA